MKSRHCENLPRPDHMHTESKKAAGSLQWQAVCKFQHEDMDDHDHAEYAAIEVQRSSKEELQVPSAQKVVQFREVLPVALETDAQHDWDTEDELVDMGDGMRDVCTKPKIAQLD